MIVVDQIYYRYGKSDKYVLQNVSCTFEEGKIYCIMGKSGSGKTTLLSLLAGLDAPTHGDIFIDNVSLSQMDLDSYRKNMISIVFQKYNLFPFLTAQENVAYPMEINGTKTVVAMEYAKKLLKKVGILEEECMKFPEEFSGGEQQRIAIARALSTKARMILADEPTGNLDDENTEKIMKLFINLARENNNCIIITSHDMKVASMADFVYTIKEGVVETGSNGR